MVRDNVTGLSWEAKEARDAVADYANPRDADNAYTWCDTNPATSGGDAGTCGDNDTEDFIAALNSGDGFGGHTDWRLPTINELRTILHRDRAYSALDSTFFPEGKSSIYWAATTYASNTSKAWGVNVNIGADVVPTKASVSTYYVRAVRGGQTPAANRFVDNLDGTVTGYTATTGPISGDCEVRTVFALNQYVITASAGPNGSISPAGGVTISHGDSQAFAITPAVGYHVADVLVDNVSVGTVTAYTFISVTSDHVIAASFTPVVKRLLTVTVAGTGKGSVTGDPAGINCPGSCSAEFDDAALVTLTAVPEQGSTFAGWSGDCANKDAACMVTMNRQGDVTAHFYRFPWPMFLPAITRNAQP